MGLIFILRCWRRWIKSLYIISITSPYAISYMRSSSSVLNVVSNGILMRPWKRWWWMMWRMWNRTGTFSCGNICSLGVERWITFFDGLYILVMQNRSWTASWVRLIFIETGWIRRLLSEVHLQLYLIFSYKLFRMVNG